jgi:hypothetical protein
MHPVCRRASDNPHAPVEQTTLLHKEVPEFLRRPWRQQPAASPELFHLGLGAKTRNLPSGDEVSA